MNNNQMYMNPVYYNAILSTFDMPSEEIIKENSIYFISYLTEIIKCLYAYLCSNDFDEVFFDNIFYKVKKVGICLEEELGILNDAIYNIEKFSINVKKYKKQGEKIPHIIFLIGNPGSGKSHVARMLDKEDANIKVIPKYTTRRKRIDENEVSETKSGMSVDEISSMKYKFQFIMGEEENLCGIRQEDIIKALQDGKNPVIATTSLELYEQIARDFPCQTHLIQINNLTNSIETQRKIFEQQGRKQEEIENRLGKSVVDDIKKYDYNLRVLINHIIGLKFASEEEQKSFIYTQLKRIFEEFGCELKLDFKPSNVLSFYDYIYEPTMYINTNNLYPFLSGSYDEKQINYLEVKSKKK